MTEEKFDTLKTAFKAMLPNGEKCDTIGGTYETLLAKEMPLDWVTNWAYLGTHTIGFLIIAALVILLCLPLRRKFEMKNLIRWSIVFTWLLGTAVYSVGFTYTIEAYEVLTPFAWANKLLEVVSVVPSAMLSSLGMFLLSDDLSDINPLFIKDLWYMAAFSVAHFLAALCSSLLIVQLLGRRFLDIFDLFICKCRFNGESPLYVFWGINHQSMALAKSVAEKAYAKKPKIVFVNLAREDMEEAEVSLLGMFNAIKMRHQERHDIYRIPGAHITNCTIVMSNIGGSQSVLASAQAEKQDIIRKELRLNNLAAMLRKAREVRMFFLDDNAEDNINRCITLMNDITICAEPSFRFEYMESSVADFVEWTRQKVSDEAMKVHMYCHAPRHTAKTSWMEHHEWLHPDSRIRLHVIDSAYLSVANLKLDPSAHPINYLDITPNTGTIDNAFNCLVVGFGETGLEAVKFLYEFGAFVDKSGQKSPFHCTVIDQAADNKRGLFYARCPELAKRGEITFVHCATDSDIYWQTIEQECGRLNYVVVAVGDDETSLNTAYKLCEHFYYHHTGNHVLPVYVRINNPANWQPVNTAKEYVDQCLKRKTKEQPVNTAKEYVDQRLKRKTKECANVVKLIPFGQIDEIFCHKVVIEDDLVRRAKVYNYEYCDKKAIEIEKLLNEYSESKMGKVAMSQECDAEERKAYIEAILSDDKCYEYVKDKVWKAELTYKLNEPYTHCDLEEICRKHEQNISNALHAKTKIRLLESASAIGPITKDKVQTAIYNLDPKQDEGEPITTDEEAVIMNVAKCEHERWNAAMRLQGNNAPDASNPKIKDPQRKLHCDMVQWDRIRCWNPQNQKETQSYDVKVVKVSIDMSAQTGTDELSHESP